MEKYGGGARRTSRRILSPLTRAVPMSETPGQSKGLERRPLLSGIDPAPDTAA